ncbi:tRNA (adenosine(37)-N6)-threonylcarbamoyltransferase complex ATPase subunit type 1 TsaE [Umboniibacter marinipuniceus]|uniref:tRNA threonylcarbamoyladenosine biosynthesis protein TsaE n=1 Tax=Umboniibacter marinipuniceus TaxID=569599 RepID=A0A3M0AAS9_9GAMM|nr:tRNA (adenosine(37)-N6)-threonylcarbamoyltransferase complex ATPase subunit type 1 TsaE [Umboniibacter marinipuniceus]RMA82263.1 tRNA threonylcarbamoyladenosine biosynthesis protein TsaE [Umboniibacter marinipuniceus]
MWLADEAATISLGQQIAKGLKGGAVVFLRGHLGAGKTTLTRGILLGFGHSGAVKSPTYTLVEPYELEPWQLFHFDLYRLGDPEELEYMGIRDYFSDQSIALIEWDERGAGMLPQPDLIINLNAKDTGREVSFEACTDQADNLVTELELWGAQ